MTLFDWIRSRASEASDDEPTRSLFDVSATEREPAWPLILRREEFDALESVHGRETDTYRLEDCSMGNVKTILDNRFRKNFKETWRSYDTLRRDVGTILTDWKRLLSLSEENIAFVFTDEELAIKFYLHVIDVRAEAEADPFHYRAGEREHLEKLLWRIHRAKSGQPTVLVEDGTTPIRADSTTE